MMAIFLTSDPVTGRALYDNEARLLGRFATLVDAEQELGELMRYCSIRPAVPAVMIGEH